MIKSHKKISATPYCRKQFTNKHQICRNTLTRLILPYSIYKLAKLAHKMQLHHFTSSHKTLQEEIIVNRIKKKQVKKGTIRANIYPNSHHYTKN